MAVEQPEIGMLVMKVGAVQNRVVAEVKAVARSANGDKFPEIGLIADARKKAGVLPDLQFVVYSDLSADRVAAILAVITVVPDPRL